ncbi:MAG: hypothetical protein WCI06_05365 [Methylococcaceae bacterium]
MIKPIKFDLKLSDGTTTLRTLDDLEENLSPALFEHFHSGKLAKWLRVRKLEEHADKVEALRTQYLDDKNELDVKLFKNLCEIFVSEVSEEDAREAMQDYQPATIEQNSNDEEIESLKAEIEALKAEIEELKIQSVVQESANNESDEEFDKLIEWAEKNNISEDSIPRNKEKLVNLSRLYLGDNRLTMLPKSIGVLSNLTDLSVYNNQLTTLPDSLEMLTNLTSLSIFGNPLTTSTKDWLCKKLPNCKIYF